MENKGHYFYVLTCRDGSYYGGYTNNLERRLKLHNEGKGAKYTRGRGPVSLTFAKEFDTKEEAMKAEYRFKQLTRLKKEQFLNRETSDINVAAEKL
ncbi:GIY-YIG nuclease family protein [Neobacillus terrae]|uniref:GIY-YIG nuclease family protein n=1 Tax=Neobacillus terrae TaxID=3034837 RepID=UPI001409E828|nr:GIY-YIG nuclease family protein [Neobacillus terrae]NHM33476.1 GIY-YIG nuclease family protein [Neobacillus terrae]